MPPAAARRLVRIEDRDGEALRAGGGIRPGKGGGDIAAAAAGPVIDEARRELPRGKIGTAEPEAGGLSGSGGIRRAARATAKRFMARTLKSEKTNRRGGRTPRALVFGVHELSLYLVGPIVKRPPLVACNPGKANFGIGSRKHLTPRGLHPERRSRSSRLLTMIILGPPNVHR